MENLKPQTDDPANDRYTSEFAAHWTQKQFFKCLVSPEQLKPTLILAYMAIALCCWKTLPVKPDISHLEPNCWSTFFYGCWRIVAAFGIFGVVPALIIKLILRERLADYGLQLGNVKRTIIGASLFTPITIALGAMSGSVSGFYTVYPFNPACLWSSEGNMTWLIVNSFLYVFLYYSAYEFFFRGFLLHGLTPTCGAINALLIQTAVSTFFHFGHPSMEMWGALGGGLLWGFIAFRTRSIISSWIQHAGLGVALDYALTLGFKN